MHPPAPDADAHEADERDTGEDEHHDPQSRYIPPSPAAMLVKNTTRTITSASLMFFAVCSIKIVFPMISCYVKFKGLNPRFHVFFVVLLFSNSFLPSEDKNPSSAISCSPFYVKLFLFYFSIKKSDTVIGGGLIFIIRTTG